MSQLRAIGVVALAIVAVFSASDSRADEFMVQLQPRSPSDQPAELLPPAPSPENPPAVGYPSYDRSLVQPPYPVQKLGIASPHYRVTYHHHGLLRRSCCGYCVPTKLVLAVQDPIRCGCAAEVCVTVPSCCQGVPYAHSKIGLLGRGIVTYKWPSGYVVQVIFKKMSPHVMVHSFAR